MAPAGLWENWRWPAGEWVRSFAIVTCPPNALCAELHNRMPVVLAPESWPAWLGEAASELAELRALLAPFPAEEMTCWPVSHARRQRQEQRPEPDRADRRVITFLDPGGTPASVSLSASRETQDGLLACGELGVIVFEAWEKVAVHVEGHLDRAVPEQRLHPLRREAAVDHPTRKEVAQRVQPVLRLAVIAERSAAGTSLGLRCWRDSRHCRCRSERRGDDHPSGRLAAIPSAR